MAISPIPDVPTLSFQMGAGGRVFDGGRRRGAPGAVGAAVCLVHLLRRPRRQTRRVRRRLQRGRLHHAQVSEAGRVQRGKGRFLTRTDVTVLFV